MPIAQISNPGGAFGESNIFGSLYLVVLNTNVNSGGTIGVNNLVVWDIGSGTFVAATNQVALSLTTSSPKYLAGVSLDSIASGLSGRIVVFGPAMMIAGVAVTQGDRLINDGTTNGRATNASATPTVGQTIGTALATQATAGSTFMAFVGLA